MAILNVKTLLIAAGLLVTVAATAADHAHHQGKGMTGRNAGPIVAATAAFDANGTLWAVHFEGEHLVVSHSHDLGAHWSPPTRVVATPEPMDGGGDAKPNIAIGPGDEIFVTWTRPLSKPYTGEVRFVRSTDGGRTFSAPRPVHADRQEITHRFDAMTVTRDGRLIIAWVDKRDLEGAGGKTGDYAGAAIYYAVSKDRGATFEGDFKLADHSCECCRIALLPRDDGSVLALWRHVFPPNIRDHALAKISPVGQVSDFRRATFDDWRVDVCPHHGPSLAADASGTLHAVWFSGTQGKEGVYYGRLADGQVLAQRRIGGETAEHADLAIAADRVAIVWKEFNGKQSVLRALMSSDRGQTFQARDLATTSEASDQPRLLVRSGRFYVFWNTRTDSLRVIALP
jgi:hypothetical protein